MSLQQHADALLQGAKPQFPEEFLQRMHALHAKMAGSFFSHAGKYVTGFLGVFEVKTSDGYEWCWSMDYRVNGTTRVRICFPWPVALYVRTSTELERSVAVYVFGDITEKDLNELLINVAIAMENVAPDFQPQPQ